METENKNKFYLLFQYLNQEGSTCDRQDLCSLPRQLLWLTAHPSLLSFPAISQEQPVRWKKCSVGRSFVQALFFSRDAATRGVHIQVCGRIETEGTRSDPLLPMHYKRGCLLMGQPSSDTEEGLRHNSA